ncbi:MAG: winged helix-turn-helix transcriptional regulator, partial [Candidatus Thermoplasmatota archaeon]|nr:winged helix-turn-helix transcriptional regulator [Candidatus Thermoplasmatota archaeon]
MLDETDRSIIEVLERDARTSLRRIAEEVGVSLGTVSNRVKKLEENGVIKGYRVIL